MRSPHSGLLAGVLDWGCLYRVDMVIPLGAFGVDTGLAGLTLGVAALPVLGVFVSMGICFSQSRMWQISFWCHPLFVGLLASGDWFQCAFALSEWVVWLFRGWPGLSGGDLGCPLGSLCLVLCGRLLPSMLVGTDG